MRNWGGWSAYQRQVSRNVSNAFQSYQRIFANLKTWALGVYHGLRKRHLRSYLDEFVFRFNRRRTPHAAFRTLLGIGTSIMPATYKMLIAADAKG